MGTALILGNAPTVLDRWVHELDLSQFDHVISMNRALLWYDQGLLPRLDHWICVDGKKGYGRDRYGSSQKDFADTFMKYWKMDNRPFNVISNEIPTNVHLLGPGHYEWGTGHKEEPYKPDGSVDRKIRLHAPHSTALVGADWALHYLGCDSIVFAGVEYDCKKLPAPTLVAMEKLLDYCNGAGKDVYTTAPDSHLWTTLRNSGKDFKTWQT